MAAIDKVTTADIENLVTSGENSAVLVNKLKKSTNQLADYINAVDSDFDAQMSDALDEYDTYSAYLDDREADADTRYNAYTNYLVNNENAADTRYSEYEDYIADLEVDGVSIDNRLAARAYYADTTAFLAATSDGQYGYVGNQLYRNNAGVAQSTTNDEITDLSNNQFRRTRSMLLSHVAINPTGGNDRIIVDKDAATVFFPRMEIEPYREGGYDYEAIINGASGVTLTLNTGTNQTWYYFDADDVGSGIQTTNARITAIFSESVLPIGISCGGVFQTFWGLKVEYADERAEIDQLLSDVEDSINKFRGRAYYADTATFLAATSDGQYGYVGR